MTLDEAWAEVEGLIDALRQNDPDWGGPSLYRHDDPSVPPYGATASPPGDDGTSGIYGYGPTPAAALLALAARLTKVPGEAPA